MMTRPRRSLGLVASALLTIGACLAVSGCDDSDASNMSITLKPDLSGSVRATRMVIPDDATGGQPASSGVSWSAAAQIVSSRGEFTNLADVRFEDLTFSCETTARGIHVLRVTLPKGPDAKWLRALTNPSIDRRRETTKSIFPDRPDSRLGSVVAITITLPAEPTSHGVSPVATGISEAVEKNVATLTVRVDAAQKSGGPIVWDLTWSDEKK